MQRPSPSTSGSHSLKHYTPSQIWAPKYPSVLRRLMIANAAYFPMSIAPLQRNQWRSGRRPPSRGSSERGAAYREGPAAALHQKGMPIAYLYGVSAQASAQNRMELYADVYEYHPGERDADGRLY